MSAYEASRFQLRPPASTATMSVFSDTPWRSASAASAACNPVGSRTRNWPERLDISPALDHRWLLAGEMGGGAAVLADEIDDGIGGREACANGVERSVVGVDEGGPLLGLPCAVHAYGVSDGLSVAIDADALALRECGDEAFGFHTGMVPPLEPLCQGSVPVAGSER